MKLADIGVNLNVDRGHSPQMVGGKLYDYISSNLAVLLLFPNNAYTLFNFSKKHNYKPYIADIEKESGIKTKERIKEELIGKQRCHHYQPVINVEIKKCLIEHVHIAGIIKVDRLFQQKKNSKH
mgnify:CR=1 FL=1